MTSRKYAVGGKNKGNHHYTIGDKVQGFIFHDRVMHQYDGCSGVILGVASDNRLFDVMLTHKGETTIVPLYAGELKPALDKVVVVVKPYSSPIYNKALDNETRFTWRENFEFWLHRHPEFAGDWKVIHSDTGRILDRGFVGDRPIGMLVNE